MRIFRLMLVGLFLGVAAGHAVGQPVVFGEKVAPFWHAASATRVDVVQIGDSNQLFAGHGWDGGWTRALGATTGLYASGLHATGENGGNSAGVGVGTTTQSTLSSGMFAYAGAPAFQDEQFNAEAALNSPLDYLYVAAGTSVPGIVSTGLTINSSSQIGINGNLRFSISYGVFAGEGPGSFAPCVRLDVSPYPNYCTGNTVFTRGPVDGVAHWSMELAAGVRAGPLNFRFARAGADTIVGPFVGYYARVENIDTHTGASVHTLYGYGGRGARSMAQFLADFTDESLTLFLTDVRRTQGPRKPVLFRLHSALNDRNETRASIGLGLTPGSSGPAYADNMQDMIDRVRGIYAANGWDERDLYFVITPSHPIAPADDASLDRYREAAELVAAANERTAVVRFDRLTTFAEMDANGWYATFMDRNHLTAPGYDELSRREVDALIAAAGCLSDIDGDGDADSDDVVEFFTKWDAGELDMDFDGDTDSDDIVVFFNAWDSGC